MKRFFRKTLSACLALSLVCGLTLPAFASEALGDDLTTKDTLLNEETQLSTNVFWSTSSSDLRTENLITYTPNDDVTPIVMAGDVLTQRSTVSAAAKELENAGYRVVAGINGDFYNVGNGLPIGIVVTEGELRSSDGGYYAVGFREDGTAVIGKPSVKVTANLGYGVYDSAGNYTEYVRQVMGVNKARVSAGGIYLYTYDFNDRHTTGNTEAGIDVVCTIEGGKLSIGDTLTLTVDQVVEASSATAIGPDQVVLSVNLQSDSYHVNALRNIPVGSEIVLHVNAASEEWNDVEYAIGALYSLVENGGVVSGLAAGANPRTAVGQKKDGTLVFYTIDGRKSGHSIGASLTQVAQRLIELGCETAICLDGGGSTTLAVTEPDELEAKTINRPSEGSERAVTNQIFLVASSKPSGRLSHFYVSADYDYVLAGSKVNLSAAAVDTNFIPMDEDYDLTASDGELNGNVLTTPKYSEKILVTARSGSKKGSTTVYSIETPDEIVIRNSESTALTELTAAPGSKTTLTATATYHHLPLKADAEAFDWDFEGDCGTIDETGVFAATTPGSGTITVKAGGKRVSLPVTVSRMPLQTVEDFETGYGTIYSPTPTGAIGREQNTDMEYVAFGKGSVKLDYHMAAQTSSALMDYTIPEVYTALNLWVYGDGSGNSLYFRTGSGDRLLVCTLDFTGWKQCSVMLPEGETTLIAIGVVGETEEVWNEETGEVTVIHLTPAEGTIYLDQMVASFSGTVDHTAPEVTLQVDGTALSGAVADAVDGVPAKSAVSVTYDGKAISFSYSESTGIFSATLPEPDGLAHRVTVTAADASGNIGRASYDVPVGEEYVPVFYDTNGYWAANYIDFLYTSGITTGYADGTFRPGQNITRAQFAVMLYRYLGLDESKYADVELPFADNAKIASYAIPAIKALYTEGIINGSAGKDGKLYFNPNNSLTRAQAATMIGRTQEKGYTTVDLTFTDAAKIPSYASYYIQTMVAQGVISGYVDGSFKPNNAITRGQMAKILYNLM